MTEGELLLHADAVTKVYGSVPALKDFSLEIRSVAENKAWRATVDEANIAAPPAEDDCSCPHPPRVEARLTEQTPAALVRLLGEDPPCPGSGPTPPRRVTKACCATPTLSFSVSETFHTTETGERS